MSIEEQLSWVVDSDSQTALALSENTRELLALRATIDRMNSGQEHIMKTLGMTQPSNVSSPDLIASSSFVKGDDLTPLSATLSSELVLLFHRLICFDLPSRAIGQFRSDEVWIGNLEGRMATHVQPPPAAEVKPLLEALTIEWTQGFNALRSKEAKLRKIAEFHARFLIIHPFLDGNGRVARALLMQQCLDLFGKADMALMNKGADYYTALQSADKGQYDLLEALIEPVIRK